MIYESIYMSMVSVLSILLGFALMSIGVNTLLALAIQLLFGLSLIIPFMVLSYFITNYFLKEREEDK